MWMRAMTITAGYFFAAGPLESAVLNKALGFEIPKEREATSGYGNFEMTVDTIAKAVKDRDYIAGNRFSAADVYAGSQIGWGLQFGTIEKKPEFEAYWSRISDRGRLSACF